MPSLFSKKYSNSKLWLAWVLVTTLVGTLSLLVPDALVLGSRASDFAGDNALFPLVRWSCGLAFVVAPLVAIVQALVLRHFTDLRILRQWVLATTIGTCAAMIVYVVANIVAFIG